MTSSPSPSRALLSVRNVTKRYGRVAALADVSFSVPGAQVVGLIGPNGSGKTTLFECIAGTLPADAGSILHDGRELETGARSSLLFYLPDGIAPWPSQRVRWALDFAIGFFGGIAARRDDVTRRLDLGGFLDKPIGSLSKGQRKRVLLAIGLMTPQPMLLADEPFDGLDLRQTREVAAVLRDYARGGRTLFLSIHQIADAARICDRFVLLSGGRVCGEGTLDELAAVAGARGVGAGRDLEEIFLALT